MTATTTSDQFDRAVRYHQSGDLAQAEPLYRLVLQADPAHANALHLLGVLAYQTGHHQDAIALLRQAIAHNATVANFHYHLGVVYKDQRAFTEAVLCFQQAVRCDPRHDAAHSNLGIALQKQRRFAEALACFQHVVWLNPQHAAAHSDMGIAFEGLGRLAEAMACYREALRISPTHVNAHINLALAHFGQGQLDEAGQGFRQALVINPNQVDAHNNLGLVLKLQGQLAQAAACHERALALKLDFAEAHSDLLFTIIFDPDKDSETIFAEHRRWNLLHAVPLAKFIRPHENDKNPERRLRIGYVSPDFREHPVGRFLLPLLAAHDHLLIEIFCYSSVSARDALTEQCRALADVWRDVRGSSEEVLADTIRHDRIDILVDLAMHTGDNRLLAFARKPAPVQVTYLAYCGTTGMDVMDYRLTDPYLDPPDRDGRFYSERSLHLPDTYWCYQPMTEAPAPAAPPAVRSGHVTFGCLNNFCKVTIPTLETWSHLLRAMPEARLLLFAPAGATHDRLHRFFAQREIAPDRLEFVGKTPLVDYFRTYERIDVALDPFPHGGGTTTCDALWMGVPVVSLAGQTALGRGGVSILSNIGLPDLVAPDAKNYVRIAAELAGDHARLSDLRTTLRDRMRKSPLMNAPRFARNVEAAYRWMWRNWCAAV